MLKKFNSNTKNLNKIYINKNINNLLDLSSPTASLITLQQPEKIDNSKTKKQININVKINQNNFPDLQSITSSLENLTEPSKADNANTKQDVYFTQVISNKKLIDTFHLDILKYSARSIYKNIDTIEKTSIGNAESQLHKFIINNVILDYGTEQPNPENFEIFIDGLHLPGIFLLKQVGNNLEIVITEYWIIDDRVAATDIKVFGKIKEL